MAAPPGYVMVFNDEFDGPLDVSSFGPGTKWIAHTPDYGDFGNSIFGMQTGNEMTTSNSCLVLKMWYDNVKVRWRSGIISSADTKQGGFSMTLGYWESRIKAPSSPGVWPAFWLKSLNTIVPHTVTCEIDIFEAYGVDMTINHFIVHEWGAVPPYARGYTQQAPFDLSLDFHIYGAEITPTVINYYFDNTLMFSTPSTPMSLTPLFCMVDFACGGGWPITEMVDPSYMYVDYVRAYQPGVDLRLPEYPINIDSDNTIGPTSGIIRTSTHLSDTGVGQNDQLSIVQNLINTEVAIESVVGTTNSTVAATHEFRIRRRPWKSWLASEAIAPTSLGPTPGTINTVPFLAFNDTTSWSTVFIGSVPWGAVVDGGVKIHIKWYSDNANGSVKWGAALERFGASYVSTDNFGTAKEEENVPNPVPGYVSDCPITIIYANCGGLLPGDMFRLKIYRNPGDQYDYMTGDAKLVAVTIEGAT